MRLILLTAITWLHLFASPALAQTSASPFTTGMRYDVSGNLTGVIAPDPDGAGPLKFAAERNSYDLAGRLVKVEKGQLADWQSEQVAPAEWPAFEVFHKVEIVYDALGRKQRETVSGFSTALQAFVVTQLVQYSYDSFGRLECTAVRMNPEAFGSLPASACLLGTQGSYGPDRITKNVYDSAGQLLRVVKAYGITTQNGFPQTFEQDYSTYSYTPNGKPETVKDANGNRATYRYDGFDRRVAWIFPAASNGAVSATCTIGSVTETQVNGEWVAGPSEVRSSGDDCEKYAYDRAGNQRSLIKRDGQVIRYDYDALSRVTVKDIPGGTAADVYYGYDLRGLQLYARFGSTSGTGITNAYDGFGRLTSTTNDLSGAARTLTYQWDENGNRTRITHPDGVYFTYAYDGLDRSVVISENGTATIATNTYDPQGRRSAATRGAVSTAYGYDSVSRLTSLADDLNGTASDVVTGFSYNPANQIISKTRSNDMYAFGGYVTLSRPYITNGLNQYSTAGSATFTYDANGNLTGDGSATYTYDVENRLITKVGGAGVDATLKYDPLGRLWRLALTGKNIDFLYDGDAMTVEYNGATLARYVHGNGDDDPLIFYLGWALTDRRSLQADAQGSIVSIADINGTATSTNTYDEYGIPGAANYGRFQYTGQMYIGQLGMYYYKARMYSPTLGRFLQTDPVGYEDQVNLYAYVANDPVNRRDPTGMYDCTDGSERCKIFLANQKITIARVSASIGTLRTAQAKLAAGERLSSGEAERVRVVRLYLGDSAATPQGLSEVISRGEGMLGALKGHVPVVWDRSISGMINDRHLRLRINPEDFDRNLQKQQTIAHESHHEGAGSSVDIRPYGRQAALDRANAYRGTKDEDLLMMHPENFTFGLGF